MSDLGRPQRILLLLLLLSVPPQLRSDGLDVATLKVALTYNFAKYVHWPDSSAGEVVDICYFADSYGEQFSRLGDKRVNDRPVQVLKLDSIAQAHQCDLVFLSNTERDLVARLHVQTSRQPVLTISDIPGYINLGGMIELVIRGDRLRFKVNQRAVKAAGLELSAQILKLAEEVKQ